MGHAMGARQRRSPWAMPWVLEIRSSLWPKGAPAPLPWAVDSPRATMLGRRGKCEGAGVGCPREEAAREGGRTLLPF